MLRLDDVALLRCVRCAGGLAYRGHVRGHLLERGALLCRGCEAGYRVADGLARLYIEDEVRGTDRLLRRIYDTLPAFHDPFVRLSFPLLQDEPEAASRQRYMRRLALGDLAPRADGPVRILEIGIGTGANLALVRRAVPGGFPLEIWGVDLSLGMLRVLEDRLRGEPMDDARVLVADAHALPFADGAFDRVFQVGAVNGYRDPRRALAEMARVSAPGSPIVVVDEQLDPAARHDLVRRAAFRVLTFWDGESHSPLELLPPGSEVIADEQAGPFFYCLSFRRPASVNG